MDFVDHAFAPHRHDTYTIGTTAQGVQLFRYRGQERHSLTGNLFVLHPDELHDGRPGTLQGFRYRALYLNPHLLQEALGSPYRALPFLRSGLSMDPRLRAAITAAFHDFDSPIEDLAFDHMLSLLADALMAVADPAAPGSRIAVDSPALKRAHDYLNDSFLRPVASSKLETVTGLSRFALARQFRACFGTSPHRYVVMRRLDHARALLRGGAALVDAAIWSGFADQSHLTRHFKRTYGTAPGAWREMIA